MASEQDLDMAMGKALDHVKANVTPNDGGVVAAAVEALREMSNDPAFAKAFNDKLAAKVAKPNTQKVTAPDTGAAKTNSNVNTTQGEE